MNGFLLDENLPPQFAEGFSLLGLKVEAIGRPGAPLKGSGDREVVEWCVDNDLMLVTKDRGRKNPEMLELIRATRVSVLMIPAKITLDEFVRQFVRRYDALFEECSRSMARGGSSRRRMTAGGRLEKL